jgi:hypothetical protein
MFVERKVIYSLCKQKMTSFRGQAGWAEMTLPGGKPTEHWSATQAKSTRKD